MKRVALLAFLAAVPLHAEQCFPPPGWQDRPSPLASPQAQPGGEIIIHGHQYPKSFNYYLESSSFTADLFGALYETLITMNPLTLEYEPGLAERWSLSDDKKTFTFWIRPEARWSDGTPVTAHDVRWTFDAIMNPSNMTGASKVPLQVFAPPEVVSNLVIRFSANEVHWRNLSAVGEFLVLPRHVLATQDFNKVNFEFPVVSGPYRLGEVKEGVSAVLVRRPDWWHRAAPGARGLANFDRVKYRFFADQENAFEYFKKGEIDLYAVYTARLWVNETAGEPFDRGWIAKQKVYNYNPVGFQGFAMNLRRAPFNDPRVRRALALLLDRAKLNRTLMYDQYFLHRSYYEDLYGATNPCPNELLPFDKEQARTLLAEAGWTVNPKTGLLEKDGTPFRFRFLNRDTSTDKFTAIYAEDLKSVGIELKTDTKDWAAWVKDMDEFNFDMTWAAWGSSIFKDPEPMWSSREAERKAGNNITGFTNAVVDALIETQKSMFDLGQRNEVCRQIDRIVTAEIPYILLWNINYTRLLYWNKFGTPPAVLSKYGNESAVPWYWWCDPDSAADLEEARRAGLSLPLRKPLVRFDEEFKPAAGGP